MPALQLETGRASRSRRETWCKPHYALLQDEAPWHRPTGGSLTRLAPQKERALRQLDSSEALCLPRKEKSQFQDPPIPCLQSTKFSRNLLPHLMASPGGRNWLFPHWYWFWRLRSS